MPFGCLGKGKRMQTGEPSEGQPITSQETRTSKQTLAWLNR